MSKVIVGMSGGVDSSVAALLLRRAGHEVTGVTIRMFDEAAGCFAEEALNRQEAAARGAKEVARALGIAHETVDAGALFKERVVDYFAEAYLGGRTPNPCIFCNPGAKWAALLAAADRLGAELAATGHYAHVVRLESGRYTLRRAAGDELTSKDQTYALYRLTQAQLARTVMPLGGYVKSDVRALAAEAGLPCASSPDSEEICFIPDGDYAGFIERKTGKISPEGLFVDEEGRPLGRHNGIIRYTVGQRKGLGLAFGRRMFVKEIRAASNEVVLSDNDSLFARRFPVRQLSFMALEDLPEPLRVFGKIRYNHRPAPAVIERTGADEVTCTFDEPQRAVTPGQSAVFYRNDEVICGGVI